MKKLGVILFFLLIYDGLAAQQKVCKLSIDYGIVNKQNGMPIDHVDVFVSNTLNGHSNNIGKARSKDLCLGKHQIKFQHPDYHVLEVIVDLKGDSSISVQMQPNTFLIDDVTVLANKNSTTSATVAKISHEQRLESQGKNLAEVLTDIAGLSILKTGSNIAKPVLNGLYGTRILLVNNNVRHESQQWGMDHAPEIDPFSGQEISVIKNADAVRYGPDALGGIILINPSSIKKDSPIHGNINSVAQSNGRSMLLNAQLEGALNNFAYRIGGTAKKAGNIRTPDYYLGNTGANELNFNALFQYKIKQQDFEVSLSHFGNELGVFTGAHIGSKEDILARIAYGRPYEHYDFSYDIQSPRQVISHDVAKINWKAKIGAKSFMEATYSLQRNHRKEYDLRRVESDNTPMADMVLTTQALEMLFHSNNTTLGLSGSLQVNNNTPGTGTTPIIPNFDNQSLGLFATQKYYFSKKTLELGLRYDYKYFDVAGYRYDYKNSNEDGSLNQYLLTDQRHFNNISGIAGIVVPFYFHWYWKSNVGLAWRAPSANELYSDGIHHGTGTYELGNPDLKSEKGIKWVNTINYSSARVNVNVDLFLQSIVDYIYANPDPNIVRQTIRGTFPLFEYRQTDAFLYGSDWSLKWFLAQKWEYEANYSLVIGKNIRQNTYLPFIPSERIQHAIRFRLNPNTSLRLNHQFVAKQYRYEEGSDFAPPPDAYHLVGVSTSYLWKINQKQQMGFQLSVENLLNSAYKDYMDRFRYYAHQQGRNILLKINYTF